MNARRARALLALLALAGTRGAGAAPSSLNTIPTADVVPPRQMTLQIQNVDTDWSGAGSVFERPEPAFQAQFGTFTPRIEAGIDAVPIDSPRDYRPVLNLKCLPVEEGDALPAIALGVMQVGPNLVPAYDAVATRTLNYRQMQYQKFRAHHRNLKLRGIRAHLGAFGVRRTLEAMAGADVQLSDHLVIDADWIAGAAHVATLGGAWVLDPQSSVQFALLRGNRDGRIDGFQVAPTHQFTW
ncbi:MAG TPA: hypothetical protein VMI75_37350 [Polyangiaceae bacterium]|nr:hypothetical protein [Polyangiaceae bacterium]